MTGSLAESPMDENWFNERRENQKKSGPEFSGPLAYGMAAGLLAVVFLVLLLVGLLLSVFLVALPVFLLHGTCLLSCPHGGTVCVQKIVLPPRGKLFTKKKKFLAKVKIKL